MSTILEARVWTKTDTYEGWMANPLLLGEGEMALVVGATGTPLNMRWGQKTPKRFSELPNVIAYDQGSYVNITSLALPTPSVTVGYSIVGEGIYTHSAGGLTIESGKLGIVNWDGTKWSIDQQIVLPTQQGVDIINPVGSGLPTEKAVAVFVRDNSEINIPIVSNELPSPTDIGRGSALLPSGIYTQGGNEVIVVPDGNIGVGKYNYTDSEYVSKYTGNFSVGALRSGGTVDGTATTYKRLGVTSASSMIATTEGERLFYTGIINNATYAGVLFYNSNLTLLGAQFNAVGSWTREEVIKPAGTAYISMCSDNNPPLMESLVSISEWHLSQLIPESPDPNSLKPENIEIDEASINFFNKDTDVRDGYSLSSGGITLENPTSSMSKRFTVDKSKTHIRVIGRVRAPFVFYTSTGTRIASPFGPDYNSGPINGVYPIPDNASTFDFAINFQGNGAGTENLIMLIYGISEDIPVPEEYIPFKIATAKAIIIDGVSYPFQVEGGSNPVPSSVKMRVKYANTDELIIISDFDEGVFLKTIYKTTGNNLSFLPNSSGTIYAEEFTEELFDSVIVENLLQWSASDGIGPYRLVNQFINTNDFVGGNHGAPEPAASTPPYYQYETSKTISHEVWADGKKLILGDRLDAERINVRVVNEVYNVDGFYVNPVVRIVDFNEIQESEFSNNQLSIKVRIKAVRNIQLKTVYSLQMQLGGALQRIFFPKSLYTSIENRTVNPNTPEGRSYGDKANYNSFDRFYVMNTAYQLVSSIWINTKAGLGKRELLLDTSPIARGKTLKLYHNILDIITPLTVGGELFYQGGVNLFKNKYNLEQAFVYEQEVKGQYDWEKSRILVIDFANYASARTIKIDIEKGKMLELLESYGDVTTPDSVTSDFFSITCNSGSGGAKYLIR